MSAKARKAWQTFFRRVHGATCGSRGSVKCGHDPFDCMCESQGQVKEDQTRWRPWLQQMQSIHSCGQEVAKPECVNFEAKDCPTVPLHLARAGDKHRACFHLTNCTLSPVLPVISSAVRISLTVLALRPKSAWGNSGTPVPIVGTQHDGSPHANPGSRNLQIICRSTWW